MKEKVDPYLRPLYDALYDMMPADKVERGLASGIIEVAPLAFMRGRTLARAAIILDEAQNATTMQMKMFLTRLGEDSKMIVTGDPTQSDLKPGEMSGLNEATRILRWRGERRDRAVHRARTWCAIRWCRGSWRRTRGMKGKRRRFRRRPIQADGGLWS